MTFRILLGECYTDWQYITSSPLTQTEKTSSYNFFLPDIRLYETSNRVDLLKCTSKKLNTHQFIQIFIGSGGGVVLSQNIHRWRISTYNYCKMNTFELKFGQYHLLSLEKVTGSSSELDNVTNSSKLWIYSISPPPKIHQLPL